MAAGPRMHSAEVATTDSVVLRRVRSRRRRVWANVALFVVLTGAMVLLSMAHRDSQSIRACRRNVDFIAEALQSLPAHQPIPLNLPMPGDDALQRQHFRYAVEQVNRLHSVSSVMLVYCSRPHSLLLQPEGRHVITYDGQQFTTEWLTEPEFRARAARSGLHIPETR